jgi:phosphatidate cytidylyltransferase
MSKERFFSAVGVSVLIAIAMLNDWAFILVLLGLTIGGLFEFFYLIQKKGIPIYSYTGIGIGVLIPLSTFIQFQPTGGWELLFIVLALLMIFMMQLARKETSNAIVGISTTLFGVLYVSWFLSFVIKIRFFLPGIDGIKLLAFLLLIVKCGDIGALLIGSRFGKTPLLARVSPNKTLEGSFGSFLTSIVAAIVFRSFLPESFQLNILQVAAIGAVFGGIGQLGDISESLIKRDCDVKDSGKLMPGLGGVLDMIDSLLFTSPAFYFFINSFF